MMIEKRKAEEEAAKPAKQPKTQAPEMSLNQHMQAMLAMQAQMMAHMQSIASISSHESMMGSMGSSMASTGSASGGYAHGSQQARKPAVTLPHVPQHLPGTPGFVRKSPPQPKLANGKKYQPCAAALEAAQRAAAAVSYMSQEEVKNALLKHGCVIDKHSFKEQRAWLQEVEGYVARARWTRTLPNKHEDQELLSCFREGYAPGSEDLLRMLETGSDVNTVSWSAKDSGFKEGMTPLLACASWGNVEELRILIAAGADLHAKAPPFDNTVLHVVIGGDIKSWGEKKAEGMIRLILESHPNVVMVKNNRGKTPENWARHEMKFKLAEYINSYF